MKGKEIQSHAIENISKPRAGVYKKQEFGRSGGGKLIHILTFWGRLIQFSLITRVKIEILFYKYSIFKHILNSFVFL